MQIQRIICINFASHIIIFAERERERERVTLTHTHSHTHTHSQSHTHVRTRCASSHAHGRATPVNRLLLVIRTLAGGEGRKRHLHSARRQTTIPSRLGYRILKGAEERVGSKVTTTILQGTGPAASAPHTRTHALGLSVCMCLRL